MLASLPLSIPAQNSKLKVHLPPVRPHRYDRSLSRRKTQQKQNSTGLRRKRSTERRDHRSPLRAQGWRLLEVALAGGSDEAFGQARGRAGPHQSPPTVAAWGGLEHGTVVPRPPFLKHPPTKGTWTADDPKRSCRRLPFLLLDKVRRVHPGVYPVKLMLVLSEALFRNASPTAVTVDSMRSFKFSAFRRE